MKKALVFAVLLIALCSGCALKGGKSRFTDEERKALLLEKERAAQYFIKKANEAFASAKKEEFVEAYLYNLANVLQYYEKLGLKENDPLVENTKQYFIRTSLKYKKLPFDGHGCLPQAVLSGLCHTGIKNDSPVVNSVVTRWYLMYETQWQRKGWGECKDPAVQLTWGMAKGQNPFVKALSCQNPDIEYTMKTYHAFKRCALDALIEKSLSGYNTEQKLKDLDIRERFWETDGMAWVIFAAQEGVPFKEKEIYVAAEKIKEILQNLENYTDIKKSPLLLSNMVRAYILYYKKVDKTAYDATAYLRTLGRKDGYFPITLLRKFEGDVHGKLTGSGSLAFLLMADEALKYLQD